MDQLFTKPHSPQCNPHAERNQVKLAAKPDTLFGGAMPNVYARYPRNGKTARELAERAGMSVRTAQRWTSEPREVFINRANEKRARIQELRAKGLSMRAIAAEIGCSVGTVHRYVKEVEEKKTA